MRVIECRRVSKSFGGVGALVDCDLRVEAGDVLGLLGQNGAGKTTLIRILLGLVRAGSGDVEVLGGKPGDPDAASRIGSTIEGAAFYPWLTGRRNIEILFAADRRRVNAQAIGDTLDRLDLGAVADRRVKGYSQGMRQRLALCAAIVHRPDLIILDEPTNGLDPAGFADLRRLVLEEQQRGATVVMSSHLLAEVEAVCDRVSVIHRGAQVAVGSVAELVGPRRQRVRVAAGQVSDALTALRAAGLRAESGSDGTLSVTEGSGRRIGEALMAGGIVAEEIAPVANALEEKFLVLTEGSTR